MSDARDSNYIFQLDPGPSHVHRATLRRYVEIGRIADRRGMSDAHVEACELTGTCNFLLRAPGVASLCAEVRGSFPTVVSNAPNCQLRLSRKNDVMEVKAMYGITSEHYAIDDDILPILDLHPAVEVRIDIEEAGVKLFIGPREYE